MPSLLLVRSRSAVATGDAVFWEFLFAVQGCVMKKALYELSCSMKQFICVFRLHLACDNLWGTPLKL